MDFLKNRGGDNKTVINSLLGLSGLGDKDCQMVGLSFDHGRGRSFNNSFVILDEAQNVSEKGMLAWVTRIGEGSKLVAVGDTSQIDAPPQDKRVNALARATVLMTGQSNFATTYLVRQVRSHLAQQAALLLA